MRRLVYRASVLPAAYLLGTGIGTILGHLAARECGLTHNLHRPRCTCH